MFALQSIWRMLVGSTLVSAGSIPASSTQLPGENSHRFCRHLILRRMPMELHHLLSVEVAGATPACSNNLAGQ